MTSNIKERSSRKYIIKTDDWKNQDCSFIIPYILTRNLPRENEINHQTLNYLELSWLHLQWLIQWDFSYIHTQQSVRWTKDRRRSFCQIDNFAVTYSSCNVQWSTIPSLFLKTISRKIARTTQLHTLFQLTTENNESAGRHMRLFNMMKMLKISKRALEQFATYGRVSAQGN